MVSNIISPPVKLGLRFKCAYFATICTEGRECYFGHVAETHSRASSQLSDFGKIVNDEWLKSFEIRHELLLDEYIIMPNHLHAIVILEKPETHGATRKNARGTT